MRARVLSTMNMYTDGGHRSIAGVGAWGFVLLRNEIVIDSLAEPVFDGHLTNQRMELEAILQGLAVYCKKYQKSQVHLIITSDSMYSMDMIRRDMEGTTTDRHVNLDLIKQVSSLANVAKPEFRWVRGHDGNHWNEAVDGMCKHAMDMSHSVTHEDFLNLKRDGKNANHGNRVPRRRYR